MACTINIPLQNGSYIPALGYGTWQAKDEELETALNEALSVGYRHIDTAYAYENEHVIGKVLKNWIDSGKLTRNELFITTKLPLYGNRAADVDKYLTESLKKLQLDYVDMYLVHCPFGCFKTGDTIADWTIDLSTDHASIWQEMERQVDNGKVRSIGVSNFNLKQVEKLLKTARIPPATNQIEHHGYLQQPELIEFLKNHKITVTAYSPLGTKGSKALFEKRGVDLVFPDLIDDPLVKELGEKYNKSAPQILLRHIIQKGLIAIPKSTNPVRMKQNIEIFDFELTDSDMNALNGLDRNQRILDFGKIFKGATTHPEYPF